MKTTENGRRRPKTAEHARKRANVRKGTKTSEKARKGPKTSEDDRKRSNMAETASGHLTVAVCSPLSSYDAIRHECHTHVSTSAALTLPRAHEPLLAMQSHQRWFSRLGLLAHTLKLVYSYDTPEKAYRYRKDLNMAYLASRLPLCRKILPLTACRLFPRTGSFPTSLPQRECVPLCSALSCSDVLCFALSRSACHETLA